MTRAGQRLELSQPAMSAALARLRRRFDDELLIRAGRDYELTPFARDLLPEVQHAVRLMGRALHLEDEFDPATSERLVPDGDERLRDRGGARAAAAPDQRAAPGVHLRIEHLGPDARSSDRVLLDYDALIAPLGFGFPGESRPLWRDRMVLPGGPGATRASATDGLTLDDLAELPHAVAALRARHPHAGRPGLRRAGHRPPDRGAGGRVAAAAVRRRGHRHGRRGAGEAGPDAHPARTARWCRWSRRSGRWCWRRGTGSPATGSPTRRTTGCSPGSTRSARCSRQSTLGAERSLPVVAVRAPARAGQVAGEQAVAGRGRRGSPAAATRRRRT